MDIKDFLSPAAAAIEVRATDKAGLLRDLASRLAPPLNSPSTLVAAALLKREELGSTGTSNGVAIPHARISTVQKPLGLLVRLNKAIEFDAIDGRPVDLVFVLLLPGASNSERLNALACVARKLRVAETLAKLRSAESDAEFYSAMVG
jgi:PTS system nitrogen regulatory IIA component